jgi:Family of unknown function (DUF5995)
MCFSPSRPFDENAENDRGKQVIESVIADMDRRRGNLPAPHLRYFLDTYQRTTRAIGTAIDDARFEDPDWVERWDVAFARLYLDALDAGDAAPRPWRLAFSAPAELPPLRHVLLGINAHVNYDLPQALLAVISLGEFGDAALLDRRRRDHERIDGVLASRVGAEDEELSTFGKTLLDRLLTPLNRIGSKRFLREGREKVWHNTAELHAARVAGPDTYRARLAELEVLSAARIADLLAPGQVILRLAVGGFGVLLPPT